MTICKQPEIGGAVPPHQDSTFLYTEPPSAVGFWYALEDATEVNGCLSFAAGTHRSTPVATRFVRKEDGGVDMVDNRGSKFPRGLQTEEPNREVVYTTGPVKAGALVLIHGNILHKSEKNTSDKSRFICKSRSSIPIDICSRVRYFSRNRRTGYIRRKELVTASSARLFQTVLDMTYECECRTTCLIYKHLYYIYQSGYCL
jgi:hypothetical protein